jgi:hypothetical protein
MTTLVLISPNFDKDFCIFSFASNDTIATVLLQKNEYGHDQPVAFYNKVLRDVEIKYDPIEKQAYALIKSLKAFMIYILQAKVIAYVPSSSVKDVLVQPDIDGKISKWIAKIIEFDIEIKSVKLVRGQGLAKLIAEENCKMLGINFVGVNAERMQSHISKKKLTYDLQVSSHLIDFEWYSHIIYFLQNLVAPPDMIKTQVRALKLKAIKLCINDRMLFWKDPSGVLLRCINKE